MKKQTLNAQCCSHHVTGLPRSVHTPGPPSPSAGMADCSAHLFCIRDTGNALRARADVFPSQCGAERRPSSRLLRRADENGARYLDLNGCLAC